MKREELNTPKMLRRARLDLNTPAELAIFKAMQEVEKAGADVRLTEATILLAKAKDCVADFVDGVEHPLPPAEGAEKRTDLRLQFERESESFWSVSAIPTIGYVRWLENKVLAVKGPIQPTAEGTEEMEKELRGYAKDIVRLHKPIMEKEPQLAIDSIGNDLVKMFNRFVTFHAQKIADKMVSERLREDLIAYDTWASMQGWDWLDGGDSYKYVDEYLKTERNEIQSW